MIDGEVNAIGFSAILLQYFQPRIVERVFIISQQTEAYPKSRRLQLSESPTHNAVALDATKLWGGVHLFICISVRC